MYIYSSKLQYITVYMYAIFRKTANFITQKPFSLIMKSV